MAQSTKKPPAPPKLRSNQQAAAVLADFSDDEGEGTAVDQLRAHLVDAHESSGAALDLLDEIEPAEE
jgi:hypothetical protein